MTATESKTAAAMAILADESHEVPVRPSYATKACPRCHGTGLVASQVEGGACFRVGCFGGQIPANKAANKAFRAWMIAKRLAWIEARGARLSQAIALVEPTANAAEARRVALWTREREQLRSDWRTMRASAAAL